MKKKLEKRKKVKKAREETLRHPEKRGVSIKIFGTLKKKRVAGGRAEGA